MRYEQLYGFIQGMGSERAFKLARFYVMLDGEVKRKRAGFGLSEFESEQLFYAVAAQMDKHMKKNKTLDGFDGAAWLSETADVIRWHRKPNTGDEEHGVLARPFTEVFAQYFAQPAQAVELARQLSRMRTKTRTSSSGSCSQTCRSASQPV